MSVLDAVQFSYKYIGQGTYSTRHDLYHCTFTRGDASETFPFQKITKTFGEPEKNEVLARICRDANDYMSCADVNEFKEKFRIQKMFLAIRAYDGCEREYQQLIELFGTERELRQAIRELGIHEESDETKNKDHFKFM